MTRDKSSEPPTTPIKLATPPKPSSDKGFLFTNTPQEEPPLSALELPLDSIDANPQQPRQEFHEKALKSLKESIEANGIVQPIVVTRHRQNPNRYSLIAGERRLRAAKLAGLKTIPAVLRPPVATSTRLALALVENLQRRDLTPLEEARALRSLLDDFGMPLKEIARKVGKDISTVSNMLRLLGLPAEVKDALNAEAIDVGHARALLAIPDKKRLVATLDIIISRGLNVRQTERLCQEVKKGKTPDQGIPEGDTVSPDLLYIREILRDHFNTKVNVLGTPERGKLELHYFAPEELDRILQRLGGPGGPFKPR